MDSSWAEEIPFQSSLFLVPLASLRGLSTIFFTLSVDLLFGGLFCREFLFCGLVLRITALDHSFLLKVRLSPSQSFGPTELQRDSQDSILRMRFQPPFRRWESNGSFGLDEFKEAFRPIPSIGLHVDTRLNHICRTAALAMSACKSNLGASVKLISTSTN